MTPLVAGTNLVLVLAQAGAGGGIPKSSSVGGRLPNGGATLATPEISWQALLPLIILGVGAVLLITVSSLVKKLPPGFFALFTVATATVAFGATVPLWARVQGWDQILWWHLDSAQAGPFSTFGSSCASLGPSCGAVGIDGFSLAITMAICLSVVLGALLASDYLRREGLDGPELYVLLLLSGAGGVVMAVANDLIVLFLGLETLSLAVYVLVALHRKRVQSQEAGFKYFILGGFSSAFFLYGVAMVYGATATTNLVQIKNVLASHIAAPIQSSTFTSISLNSPLLLLGLVLMLVGLGFKVAAVPFHFWSPDAYDGAPSPVTAYMAASVKAAAFAALVRVFVVGFETYTVSWRPMVAALSVLSMVVGSVLAIVQTNVKRTLAYSSISHAGFILMAMQASSSEGNTAIVFYIITYTFMVAGSFGVVAVVSRRGDQRTSLADFRGLGASNPGLALVLTIFLLAQAGIPFTSGFVAKLYAIIATVAAGATWLAIIAMLSSVIAAYLYLRIIVSMYMTSTVSDGALAASDRPARITVPFPAALALGLCFIVTVGAGILPGPLTDFSTAAQPVLVNVVEPPVVPSTEPLAVVPSNGSANTPPAGSDTAPDPGTPTP